jgi:hypothetical protein
MEKRKQMLRLVLRELLPDVLIWGDQGRAGVAKLADAAGLGPAAITMVCGFKSRRPHHHKDLKEMNLGSRGKPWGFKSPLSHQPHRTN